MTQASRIMRRVAAIVILDSLSKGEREMESEMMSTSEWVQRPKYSLLGVIMRTVSKSRCSDTF